MFEGVLFPTPDCSLESPQPYPPHPRGEVPRGCLGGEFDLGVTNVPKNAHKANIKWIDMR